MALEPPPFAVRTLGPSPKQVSMLPWRMNILPFVGRRGPNNLVEPSLRVQMIRGTAFPVGMNYAFLLPTQTVEGYGPILSIRVLHMLSPRDIYNRTRCKDRVGSHAQLQNVDVPRKRE